MASHSTWLFQRRSDQHIDAASGEGKQRGLQITSNPPHASGCTRSQGNNRMSKFSALALCPVLLILGCESYAPSKSPNGIFASCCSGAGTCVPTSSVRDQYIEKVSQDTCGNALMCVPTGLAESQKYVPPSCRSYGQIEGRCLPSCLPDVAKRAGRLLQDGCAEANLCVPCFDPVTSESTGACDVGGDHGPREAPTPFAACCGDQGRCVPASIIEAHARKNLGADSCEPATDSLCVPNVWVENQSAKPSTCRAHGNLEGRCLSECLPEVASRAEHLNVDSCQTGQRCVPCFDPITGEPNDACTLSDDAPTEPPRPFESCCEGVSACVPADALSTDDKSRLSKDTCKTENTFCVPRSWAARNRKAPTTCRAHGDAEGRCLARCLPDVTKRADRLRQDSCDDVELCVPCYDSLTGEDTGACSTGVDPGPSEAPLVFAECCDSRGRCIPATAIDDSPREQLDARSCSEQPGSLCVPDAWVADPDAKPKSCRAYGDAEGRCLSECLPDVAKRVGKLRRDRCEAAERCVPCFDPITGEKTSACTLHGDAPSEPPLRFDDCCGGIGACVPGEALDSDDKGRLEGSECRTEDARCAPKAWTRDDRSSPTECRAPGDIEGRCLPSCLPDVAQRKDRLQRVTCDEAYLCVPCFDPVTMESTRACNIGADLPHELPKPFTNCCDGVGRCVPNELVSTGDREKLDSNTCELSDTQLCVPEDWVKSDRFIPASCVYPGDVEGRCLPECLPDVAGRARQLTAAGCAEKHLCVPCYDPLTGEDTHACSVGNDKPPSTPKVFANCCGGAGVCVPGELVSTNERSQLGKESCGSSDDVCAPRSWVGDTRTAPRACSAYEGAEGRCLPTCLPDVSAKQAKLRQDVCAATERCVPCFDPIDGHDTQACHIANDEGPTRPPTVFSACCNDLGRCIPTDLVSTGDRTSLGADSCHPGDHLCAPTEWLGEMRKAPASCHGYLAAEGRCLPNCLPRVAAQDGRLIQDTCSVNMSCVPCFDPVTGTTTGACNQTGDPGPIEKKKTFEKCCDGAARCIPSAAIDPKDRGRLGKDKCKTPTDALCVPTEWLSGERTAPPKCRAPGNIEGRCLLSCLPEVAKRADQLRQTTCTDEDLCVPCFDPLNGMSTGACSTEGDAPTEGPKLYPSCCGTAGTCVPEDLLDGTGSLNHESCADPESYCVPYEGPRGIDPHWNRCNSTWGKGACLQTCFIAPSRRGFINRNVCRNSELCVPCSSLDVETAVCE